MKHLPFIIWFAALLCGFFFLNAYQLELFAAAVVVLSLCACVSVGRLSKGARDGLYLSREPFVLLLLAFWALMGLSVALSEVRFISFIGFGLSSILPLTFFTFIAKHNMRLDFKVIVYPLAILMGALCVWALVQFYMFSDEFGGQARHPLANPNSLAAVFSLGLFASIGGALSLGHKGASRLCWGLALLIFAGMTATASRGAFLAALAALILFVLLNLPLVARFWRQALLFLVAAAVVFSLTMLNEVENIQIAQRLGRVLIGGDYADMGGSRIAIWQGIWQVIQGHWLFGTGIGTLFLYYPEFRMPWEHEGVVMGHSDPLQFLAELGVFGTALFYAIGVAFGVRTWRAVKVLDKNAPERVQILAVFCAIFALVLHAHVTFNFYVVPILFIGGMMLSWWYLKTAEILGEQVVKIPLSGRMGAQGRQAVLIIPLILLTGIFASFMASEHLALRAKAVIAGQDLTEFTRLINLSDEIGLRQNHTPYLLAVTVPMSILEVEKDRMPNDKRRQIFQEAWGFLNRVEAINPRNASTAYYRGYMMKSVPEKFYPPNIKTQEAYFQDAIRLNPLHISARLELLEIYRNKNDMDRFEKTLADGLRWRYNTQRALSYYAQAERYYLFTEQVDEFGKLQKEKNILRSRIKKAESKKKSTRLQRMFSDHGDEL